MFGYVACEQVSPAVTKTKAVMAMAFVKAPGAAMAHRSAQEARVPAGNEKAHTNQGGMGGLRCTYAACTPG